MPTPPPPITALPTPPDPNDRSTFNARAYPWSVAQQTLATEIGAVATNVKGNADDAVAAATASQGYRNDAGVSAALAAASAASAINSAGTSASSSTSLALTAGAKAWTIQTGKLFPPGQPIFLASAADPTKRMSGTLLTHNSATGACTANMTPDPGATGTYADWVMGVGVSSASSVSMPRVARTSNVALGVGDKGKLIDITSGTFAQTTDAAGTLGADWLAYLANTGTGAPTWNGITLTQGAMWMLHSDGATVRGYPVHLPGQTMVVREEQVSGTSGGTPGSTGAWLTRTLNAVQSNSIAGASLASNQVTLPAGTYLVEGSAPACRATGHQARLYNVTGAAVLLMGTPEVNGTTEYQQTRSVWRGQFTLAAASAIRVEHQVGSAFTHGFGYPLSWGPVVFTEMTIRRIGP